MNDGFSTESVITFLKQHFLMVGITLGGALLIFIGFVLMNPTRSSEEVIFEAAETEMVSESTSGTGKESVFVDVAGAVVKPGVYELANTSRVSDALLKAGGLADEADRQGVAKTMNLAAKVTDGMKIYFPFQGESAGIQTVAAGNSNATGSMSTHVGGLININTGSASELESLPGVGAVTAGKIINGRPYTSVEELKSKKVVGNAVYEKIKDLVTVN